MQNNLTNIESGSITEFYDGLNKLYDATALYRTALREGEQIAYDRSRQNLMTAVQEQYNFYEKNKTLNPNLAEKALDLVNQFNSFVPYFNQFSNAEDRTSAEAQETAKKAESLFACLVNLTVAYLTELKPYIVEIERKQAESSEKSVQFVNNNIINNNNNNSNINDNYNFIKIDIKIDITIYINTAIQQVNNSDLDYETKQEVLQKLAELRELSKEKDKQTRGKKVLKFLKWVGKQTIEIAKIVLPVILAAI